MRHSPFSLCRQPVRIGRSAAALLAVFAAAGVGQTAAASLATAAREADADAVRQFIESGADVNEPEADGTSALLWAAYQQSPELVSLLLESGADPNAANQFGITPLLQASRYGDAELIKLLLDGGADLAAATRDGETPLMAASRAGSVEAVKVLLEHGADPNATESLWDQTALMWATAEGHLDVVDALLAAGADPNAKARVTELAKRSTRTDFPSGGFTALMWAVRDGNEAILRRLLEGGADINATDGDGATAIMLAIVNDRFDLAATMLELGADPKLDDSLYQAVVMHDATTDWRAKDGTRLRADHLNELTALDLIGKLLDAGADPNRPFTGQLHSTSMCCDTKGAGTPFFRAAIAADVEAMKLMIARGADLEWSPKPAEAGEMGNGGPPGGGNAGKTPLMVAMNGGKGVGMAGGPGDIREGAKPPFREPSNRDPVDAVDLLIEAGANVNAVTSKGESALHLAATAGKLDVVRALAAGGADLNLKNGDGKTALEIVENQEPREEVTQGAQVSFEKPAQPAEVAALLRELMHGGVQARVEEGPAQ
jgi:ankyrin repeat protein